MLVISALSLEFVHVSVSLTSGGVDIDPTGDQVFMAFVAQGATPGLGDFKVGSWVQDPSTTPTTHFARLLLGPNPPGVLALTPGLFDCYVRVVDSLETPTKKAGPIRII